MKKVIKRLLPIFLALVLVFPSVAEEQAKKVVDEADLLEKKEELTLEKELKKISVSNEFDLAVVTVNSLNGEDVQVFADNYYDEHGYGYGADRDGALLLVSMEERDWYITTCGSGIYFIDDALDYIEAEMVPYLSDGEYLEAFETFASCCEEVLNYEEDWDDYDYKDDYDEYYEDWDYDSVYGGTHKSSPMKIIGIFMICLLVGFLLAFVCMKGMVDQMKNVNFKAGAGDYMREREPNLTVCHDRFLYHHISKTPKPKEETNSSHHPHTGGHAGGGSHTHISSGGHSHGGGGGKF